MPDLAVAQDATAAWVERNPLREWRSQQQISGVMLAPQIGVSEKMLRLWETGQFRPRFPRAALTDLLGADIAERWDTWLKARPGEGDSTR